MKHAKSKAWKKQSTQKHGPTARTKARKQAGRAKQAESVTKTHDEPKSYGREGKEKDYEQDREAFRKEAQSKLKKLKEETTKESQHNTETQEKTPDDSKSGEKKEKKKITNRTEKHVARRQSMT